MRKGPDEVRDVQNIADILVDPEVALKRRSHWEKTCHNLLVDAILHVLYAEEEKTFALVATFLSDPRRSFAHALRRMMATNHLGTPDHPQVHPIVASAAREVLNKSENERSGVLSTVMSFLGLYRDPRQRESAGPNSFANPVRRKRLSTHHQRIEPETQGLQNINYGCETRIPVSRKSLVQALPAEPGLGLRGSHASATGDVAHSRGNHMRIAVLEGRFEIGDRFIRGLLTLHGIPRPRFAKGRFLPCACSKR